MISYTLIGLTDMVVVEVYVCGKKCPKMWPSVGVARSGLWAPVMMMTMVIVKVVMVIMMLNYRQDQYLGSGNNQGLDLGNVGLSRKGPRTLVYQAFDTY